MVWGGVLTGARSGDGALMTRTLVALLVTLLCLVLPAPAMAARDAGESPSRWIVTLRDDADVTGFVSPAEQRLGFRATQVYRHVAHGFAAALTPSQRLLLLRDPRVASVSPDRPFELTQTLPPGIDRVQADRSPVANIDGSDQRVDADIAIIDTGIQRNHPDLNVVGGYNCVGSDHADWDDNNGHGTHVAGIAAAKDNGIGVVGVAPGARLWAVRVFPPNGTSWESWIVCGLEWVASQRDANDPDGERIEAVNLSLRGTGGDDGHCGAQNADLMHRAVCDAVAAGVTVVVAAGNDATDARYWTPAAYDEAITVSGIGDYNGRPGGGAGAPCSTSTADDHFATFSNYGADVDITAPAVCVLSTYRGSSYARISGTSMAAPHVTGAAALYKATHGRARPTEVRAALVAAGAHDWVTSTDPDGTHEPLLDVESFTVTRDFSLLVGPGSAMAGPGRKVRYQVMVGRRGGFYGAIDLTVSGLPAGASATFAPSRLAGSADASVLEVTAPDSGPPASATLRITGRSSSRTHNYSVHYQFEPVFVGGAPAPMAHLPAGTVAGTFSLPATVRWSAIAGATRYQFQQSLFEGSWATVSSTVTGTSLQRWEWPGFMYRYRIRAMVGGVWRAWVTGARHSPKDYSGTVQGIHYSSGDWTMAFEDTTYSTRPLYATHAGATATFTFKGREVAWISTKDTNRGKVNVYIDGSYVRTLDLRASSRQTRRVVLSRSWTEPGTHTIALKVLGTSGRPRVDVDALIVIN